jgi:hypothetical protein
VIQTPTLRESVARARRRGEFGRDYHSTSLSRDANLGAIVGKRTCPERRESVDPTQLTDWDLSHAGSCTVIRYPPVRNIEAFQKVV